jgi:DNA-binding CsgD family transcriptional regulator
MHMNDEAGQAFPRSVFDEIDCSLIVCDSQATILYANQAAEQELWRARLLVRQLQRLRSVTDQGTALDSAIVQAARRGRRSLVTLRTQADHLMVSVVPLGAGGTQGTQVLVMLGRREPCSWLGLQLLASSYGLTVAETRVLAALTRRATPREIATQNAVALSTVRTQILSLRAKLAERNIEGLLLRTAQLPPVASALRTVSSPEVEQVVARADLFATA